MSKTAKADKKWPLYNGENEIQEEKSLWQF